VTNEECIQLQKDIKKSREAAIQYNADVLNGDVCLRRRHGFVKYLKEIQDRARLWHDYLENGDEYND
jgi:hypothetical protein